MLVGLVAFAFVSSITPGPNNMMLMASGANFGVRQTVPHMLGVALGFGLMVALVGIGLVTLFDQLPVLHVIIKWAGIAYLVWLAGRIATSGPPVAGAARNRPFSFLQAAAFQWVNPKAWTMALGAIAAYAPHHDLTAVLWVAAVFTLVNFPSVGAWAVLGQGLGGWLADPRRLRIFNYTMAGLLLASLWPAVAGTDQPSSQTATAPAPPASSSQGVDQPRLPAGRGGSGGASGAAPGIG